MGQCKKARLLFAGPGMPRHDLVGTSISAAHTRRKGTTRGLTAADLPVLVFPGLILHGNQLRIAVWACSIFGPIHRATTR
jgi:hypothetical protein